MLNNLNIRTLCFILVFSAIVFTGLQLNAEPDTIGENKPWATNGWDGLDRIGDYKAINKSNLRPQNYALTCHRDNFDLFFSFFADDPRFQEATTLFPLKISTYSTKGSPTRQELKDGTDVVLIAFYYLLSSVQPAWASIFPSRHQRLNEHYFYYFNKNEGEDCVVTLGRREWTGFNIQYVFKWDGCWFLAEIIESTN